MRKFMAALCAAICLFVGGCGVQEEYYTVSVSDLKTGQIVYVLKNVTFYQMDKARRGTNIRTLNGHTSNKRGEINDFCILLLDDMAYTAIKQEDLEN